MARPFEALLVLALVQLLARAALAGPAQAVLPIRTGQELSDALARHGRSGAGAKKSGGRWNHPDTAVLYAAPADPRAAERWRGPYLDEAVPLDPWDTPYQYSIPGRDGQAFALYSLGADKAPGGEGNSADIGVLPPSE